MNITNERPRSKLRVSGKKIVRSKLRGVYPERNQYPTDIGRIDILAVHKTQPRFLVIELKRNQSSD